MKTKWRVKTKWRINPQSAKSILGQLGVLLFAAGILDLMIGLRGIGQAAFLLCVGFVFMAASVIEEVKK